MGDTSQWAPDADAQPAYFSRNTARNQTFVWTVESEPDPWKELGNCLGVDPELFFPERGASTKEAKEVCRGCEVRERCLEYAMDSGEKHGIWGGMSERQRRRLRRERALGSAS